jgi:hypothetical protein
MKSLQMKKLALSSIAAAAMLASAIPSAQAVTATSGNFNVNITLSPSCSVTTPAAINLTYTSFQGTTSTGSSGFSVTCTNSLTYTPTVSGAATTDNAVNLAYTLGLTAPVGGGTGTGAAQAYTVDATIALGQSGTCNSLTSCTNAAATNQVHTVTITY